MRRLSILTSLLLLVWLAAGWFFSGMILYPGEGGRRGDRGQRQQAVVDPVWTMESVRISVADNVALAGEYYRHSQPQNRAVIFSPGRGANLSQGHRFMPLFKDLGCDVLLLQQRGVGESTDAAQTFGYHEKHDLSEAIEWLIERTDCDAGSIGLIGVSYGSAVSIQTLALRDDLAFVIADSTFTDLRTVVTDQANRMFGGWINAFVPMALALAEWRGSLDIDDVSVVDGATARQTPILLMHALHDRRGSSAYSQIVFDSADPSSTMLSINDWGNGHGGDIRNFEMYQAVVQEFLQTHAPEFLATVSPRT